MAKNARLSALDYDPKTGKKDDVVEPEKVETPEVPVEEAVDPPVDEIPEEEKEEVHLNINNPEDNPDQPEGEEIDFWGRASEILGKKVLTAEDLVIEKEVEKIVEKEVEYATEFSKAYDKFYRETNRSVEDFLSANVDVTTLSPEEIVKRSLKLNNPNFDQDDVNADFEFTYGIDEDTMDEREIAMKKLALKKAVNKGTKEIESIKKDFFVPLKSSDAAVQKATEERQTKIEEERKLWREAVSASSSKFKGVDIKVSDSFTFTQKASPEDLAYVKDVVSDDSLGKYLERYATQGGALDTGKMLEDQFWIRNRDSIIAEAVKQAKAEERGEIIKKDKNIDFKSNKTKQKPVTLTKRQQEVRDLITAKNKNRLNIR